MHTLDLYWPSQTEGKPKEDAWRLTPDGVTMVADGVTRTPVDGVYPSPSPARMAADAFLQGAHEVLMEKLMKNLLISDLSIAVRNGNARVQSLNGELGFWDATDYAERDLAGCVAAILVPRTGYFVYAFLTDCGVARLSPNGKILWMTPDPLADVRPHFPPPGDFPTARDRTVHIRQCFRNVHGSRKGTYGVFTGEKEAIPYVEISTQIWMPEDRLLCFSDGIRPFLEQPEFLRLLADLPRTSDPAPVRAYVDERSTPDLYADEKTLVMVYQ